MMFQPVDPKELQRKQIAIIISIALHIILLMMISSSADLSIMNESDSQIEQIEEKIHANKSNFLES